MKLNEFAEEAPGLFEAGVSVKLRSPPGRGKTTVIESLPPILSARLGKKIGFSPMSGPNLNPGDTVGFGIPKHNDKYSQMVFTLPFFWTTPEGKLLEEYDGGIIFVDEDDKMDVDIKKVMGEMALSGRCGPHRLPPGWVVWMAGNRAEDRSGSTRELDHLINRRLEINVDDDIEGWEDWAQRNHIHHSFIAFAKSNPNIVFPTAPPEKQGPFCTPRSLCLAAKTLVTVSGKTDLLRTDDRAKELVGGFIGGAASGQLFSTLMLEAELPSIESIVADPDGAKLPTAPDAQMLVCYKLVSLAKAETLKPIVRYVERLPADMAAPFAKGVVNRTPAMVANPAMLDWCKRNSSLMNMLAALKN
jgi:hypothetical protein